MEHTFFPPANVKDFADAGPDQTVRNRWYEFVNERFVKPRGRGDFLSPPSASPSAEGMLGSMNQTQN